MKQIFIHNKTGNLYELIAEAKDSETKEEMMVYKGLKTGEVWVRPRKDFFDTVELGGKYYTRFGHVKEK